MHTRHPFALFRLVEGTEGVYDKHQCTHFESWVSWFGDHDPKPTGEVKSLKTLQAEVLDANQAVASVAFLLSEVVMGEHSAEWSASGKLNLWGQVRRIVEMQVKKLIHITEQKR